MTSFVRRDVSRAPLPRLAKLQDLQSSGKTRGHYTDLRVYGPVQRTHRGVLDLEVYTGSVRCRGRLSKWSSGDYTTYSTRVVSVPPDSTVTTRHYIQKVKKFFRSSTKYCLVRVCIQNIVFLTAVPNYLFILRFYSTSSPPYLCRPSSFSVDTFRYDEWDGGRRNNDSFEFPVFV